jgi:hypothetical protein
VLLGVFMHAVEYGSNIDSFSNIWLKNTARNLSQELRNTDMYRVYCRALGLKKIVNSLL